MNQITGNPNTYDFGLDFNYAVWTPNTRLTLVNVPWNNDYRDIVRFADKAALNTYLNSIENSGVVVENVSYAKPSQPVRVNIPFNAAAKYNYLRASNQTQPVAGDLQKDYYYFITDVRYIAPNTTEIVVQLDVWQTYGYDVTFGNCYVERGHIGIANENAFNNYGRDYLTVPEGMDIGNEYKVVSRVSEQLMNSGGTDSYVLVYSSINLSAGYGDVNNPSLYTAVGGHFEYIPSGMSTYIFTRAGFASLMAYLSGYPWIAQGIHSISLIPNPTRYGYNNLNISTVSLNNGGGSAQGVDAGGATPPSAHNVNKLSNWRDVLIQSLPEKYRILKKFLTFPYCVVELNAMNGDAVPLKPELWASASAYIDERVTMSMPNQRITISPANYNNEVTEVGVHIANLPQLPIVSNAGLLYMASNAHQLAYQGQSADWSQQRAMGAGQTAYDQATANVSQMENAARISRNADIGQTALNNQVMMQQTIANAAFGIAGGAASGGAAGGGIGAAAGAVTGAMGGLQGAVNYGIQSNANTQGLAIRNASNTETTRSAADTGMYIRDTNKSLVDWAARGDYENTIAGINAKVQDAKLTPPSIIGQSGGETFNIVNGLFGYVLKFKLPQDSTIKVIGDYWLRYGYSVRRFVSSLPANMMVMEKFTYWKLTETYITSAPMPEGFKQAIRGIFEKGVTVWANPAYIGTTDLADNQALEGITL